MDKEGENMAGILSETLVPSLVKSLEEGQDGIESVSDLLAQHGKSDPDLDSALFQSIISSGKLSLLNALGISISKSGPCSDTLKAIIDRKDSVALNFFLAHKYKIPNLHSVLKQILISENVDLFSAFARNHISSDIMNDPSTLDAIMKMRNVSFLNAYLVDKSPVAVSVALKKVVELKDVPFLNAYLVDKAPAAVSVALEEVVALKDVSFLNACLVGKEPEAVSVALEKVIALQDVSFLNDFLQDKDSNLVNAALEKVVALNDMYFLKKYLENKDLSVANSALDIMIAKRDVFSLNSYLKGKDSTVISLALDKVVNTRDASLLTAFIRGKKPGIVKSALMKVVQLSDVDFLNAYLKGKTRDAGNFALNAVVKKQDVKFLNHYLEDKNPEFVRSVLEKVIATKNASFLKGYLEGTKPANARSPEQIFQKALTLLLKSPSVELFNTFIENKSISDYMRGDPARFKGALKEIVESKRDDLLTAFLDNSAVQDHIDERNFLGLFTCVSGNAEQLGVFLDKILLSPNEYLTNQESINAVVESIATGGNVAAMKLLVQENSGDERASRSLSLKDRQRLIEDAVVNAAITHKKIDFLRALDNNIDVVRILALVADNEKATLEQLDAVVTHFVVDRKIVNKKNVMKILAQVEDKSKLMESFFRSFGDEEKAVILMKVVEDKNAPLLIAFIKQNLLTTKQIQEALKNPEEENFVLDKIIEHGDSKLLGKFIAAKKLDRLTILNRIINTKNDELLKNFLKKGKLDILREDVLEQLIQYGKNELLTSFIETLNDPLIDYLPMVIESGNVGLLRDFLTSNKINASEKLAAFLSQKNMELAAKFVSSGVIDRGQILDAVISHGRLGELKIFLSDQKITQEEILEKLIQQEDIARLNQFLRDNQIDPKSVLQEVIQKSAGEQINAFVEKNGIDKKEALATLIQHGTDDKISDFVDSSRIDTKEALKSIIKHGTEEQRVFFERRKGVYLIEILSEIIEQKDENVLSQLNELRQGVTNEQLALEFDSLALTLIVNQNDIDLLNDFASSSQFESVNEKKVLKAILASRNFVLLDDFIRTNEFNSTDINRFFEDEAVYQLTLECMAGIDRVQIAELLAEMTLVSELDNFIENNVLYHKIDICVEICRQGNPEFVSRFLNSVPMDKDALENVKEKIGFASLSEDKQSLLAPYLEKNQQLIDLVTSYCREPQTPKYTLFNHILVGNPPNKMTINACLTVIFEKYKEIRSQDDKRDFLGNSVSTALIERADVRDPEIQSLLAGRKGGRAASAYENLKKSDTPFRDAMATEKNKQLLACCAVSEAMKVACDDIDSRRGRDDRDSYDKDWGEKSRILNGIKNEFETTLSAPEPNVARLTELAQLFSETAHIRRGLFKADSGIKFDVAVGTALEDLEKQMVVRQTSVGTPSSSSSPGSERSDDDNDNFSDHSHYSF